MGLVGQQHRAQSAVLDGVGQSLVVRRRVLPVGADDLVFALGVVEAVVSALHHLFVGGDVPGVFQVFRGVEAHIAVVEGAVDDAQVDLAAAGDLMARHRDLGGGVDILRRGADQAGAADHGVIVFGLLFLEDVVGVQAAGIQSLGRDVVGILFKVRRADLDPQLLVQHGEQDVVQGVVAAVHQRRVARAAGPLGVSHHADVLLIHELQGADKIHRVQAAHGGAEDVVFQNALVVFVIHRRLAGAGAVGVDVEHHIVALCQLFGKAAHLRIDNARARHDDHRRVFVFIGGAHRVIQFALQRCAAGVDGDVLHLDAAAVGGDELGKQAAEQDYSHQHRQHPLTAQSRAEIKDFFLGRFHCDSSCCCLSSLAGLPPNALFPPFAL